MSKDTAQQIVDMRERWLKAREALKPYHTQIARDYDFLIKQEHYGPAQQREAEETGSPLVRTVDLYDMNRYASAEVAGTKIYLDVKPGPNRDEVTSPAVAELTRKMMEREIHDVRKGYPAVRRAVIRMGSAARAGAAVLEVVPNASRLGTELVPVAIDPTTLVWDADYQHFNQPGCPWLAQVCRPRTSYVKERWKLTAEQIGSDDGYQPITRRSADPKVPEDDEHDRVTLLKVWYMKGYPGKAPENPELPTAQRYMLCERCGYTEQPLTQMAGYDGTHLPDRAACPACASTALPTEPQQMMARQDRKLPDGEAERLSERGFQIFAPFFPLAGYLEDKPLGPKINGFPAMLYVPDPFPLEPFGNSDAFLHRDVQCAKDAVLRMALEQMQRNRDLLIVKEDALWNAQHEPYQFDGSGDYVAFASSLDDIQAIRHFQGSGMNAATPAMLGILDGAMQRTRGTGQFNVASAQDLKGTTATGITRAQETGDVPVDERIAIWRETETLWFYRWLEYGVTYWSSERWRRVLGIEDGNLAMELIVDPDELDVDIQVSAEPGIDPAVQAKLEAFDQIVAGVPALAVSPEALEIKMRIANLPEEWTKKMLAAASRMVAPPVGAGGATPGPGMGPAQPAGMPQGLNGPSPAMAGMAPGQ